MKQEEEEIRKERRKEGKKRRKDDSAFASTNFSRSPVHFTLIGCNRFRFGEAGLGWSGGGGCWGRGGPDGEMRGESGWRRVGARLGRAGRGGAGQGGAGLVEASGNCEAQVLEF
ncbi:hypothetical protein E2C01_005363 [Portunus trituberculatus]|uniref:Uncharacterized protein n=1 Tax=Portunus trituberculatus TaxID=210409 RepID=A0A5B7CTC0_PORTR|nr:hypothetical protein [Portunus trituberculatus]